MFRRHKKRHTNIVFVIFRLFLSLVIFAALLAGAFSAYKHFSGVNLLSLSPKTITDTVFGLLSQPKLVQNLQKQITEKVLGQSKKSVDPVPAEVKSGDETKESLSSKLAFRFALFADSHSDNIYLNRALNQIKKNYSDIRFIIGLGDYTEVGTSDELKRAKNELDSSGFRYFVIPGDHDLWDSRNKQSLSSNDGKSIPQTANFEAVFGPPYQSFTAENFLFIILQNSDNYLGLGEEQKRWLSNQLNRSNGVLGIFVFLHEPLFHPSSDHFMGRVEEKLKKEAQSLIKEFAKANVKKVFSGDTHFFSEFIEPETKLEMITIGAITSSRNLQNPRFAIVSVYEDGSTKVEDVEVK